MRTARPIPSELLADPRLADRMADRIVIRNAGYETDCWESTYTVHRSGYARMTLGWKLWRVHRIAYALWVGDIPAGMVLDHLCRNKICCNPDHLEPVTQRENTMRGDNHVAGQARATRCIHGHEFTEENTRWNGKRRQCRTCHRAAGRKVAA